jgi:2-haloacid dehalogenase
MTDKIENIEACVFDAYGTVFDVNAAAAHCADALGDNWQPLAEIWRGKQLSYTWLRTLMDEYVDFEAVTADALDYAMASLGIEDDGLRARLLALYLELDAYPEAAGVLAALQTKGLKTAILSNGNSHMLDAVTGHAGLADKLDAVISVDAIRIYKPSPAVYQMAVDQLTCPAQNICFMSSNAWDVAGAANFGFQVLWVNRFGQTAERLPGKPAGEITDLSGLLSWI